MVKLSNAKVVLIIFVVGFLVYFNSLGNQFLWDDEEQILRNSLITSLGNIGTFFQGSTFNSGGAGVNIGSYYKPLLTTYFAFLYSIFGPNPFGFHLIQVLLHILNAILIFYLFKKFFSSSMSLFLSLIFLVHPINSESVDFIAASQEVLFFFFGIIALLLSSKSLRFKWWWVLALLLISALFKETGLLFILLVPIYHYFFEKKNFVKSSVVSIGVLSIYLILRFGLAASSLAQVGIAPITQASFLVRLISIPREIYYYLSTFFLPFHLITAQYWIVDKITWPDFYLPLLVDGLVFGLLILSGWFIWKKEKLRKVYLFFSVWFLLSLGIHLNIIPLDMTVADRWFYLPIVGLLGIVGVILNSFENIRFRNKFVMVAIFGAVVVVLLSVRTIIRNSDWKDGLTLFSETAKYQTNYSVETQLCYEMSKISKYSGALPHCLESTKEAPDWWVNWDNLGAVYLKLAFVTGDKSYVDKGESAYRESIKNADYYLAYENLATLLMFYRSPKESADFAKQALGKFPYNWKFWMILAVADDNQGNKDQALKEVEESVALNQNSSNQAVLDQLLQGVPVKIIQSEK